VLTRRQWLGASLGSVAAILAGSAPAFAAAPLAITVYKDPGCGCCNQWVAHLEKHGFVVTARNTSNVDEVKDTFGVPSALRACHTATLGTYVVEGHVPADLIQKMWRERPALAGLAVPGMPSGSPGMEGGRAQAYDVIAFRHDGTTSVYAHR